MVNTCKRLYIKGADFIFIRIVYYMTVRHLLDNHNNLRQDQKDNLL